MKASLLSLLLPLMVCGYRLSLPTLGHSQPRTVSCQLSALTANPSLLTLTEAVTQSQVMKPKQRSYFPSQAHQSSLTFETPHSSMPY